MSKKIIVTGGSRGIGFSIAEKLLKDGFDIHICARDESGLKAGVEKLSKFGLVDCSVLDLSDREAVKNFCDSWEGDLYGLVNNAGICKTERLDESSGVWDDVLNTNLNGLYFLTKGLLPYIINNGRIVNISSQLGKDGRAGYGAYCASKFAVNGLTKCWAKELGGRGITVNSICPGWVKTGMAEKDLERLAREKGMEVEKLYQQICEPLELKRFTEPKEVANLVSFLISVEGSGVTGRSWLLNTIWNQE